MKRFFFCLLLMCLLLTVLPLCAMATEGETASNRCGENLTWSYNGGTLTITGTGEMDSYSEADAPWLEYKDSITKLVFTGGVTSVGDYAFMDYDNLKEINFGASMHTIGSRAFKSCDGLTKLSLPSTFRKFGEECFMGCQNLTEIRCNGGMPSFKASCVWDTNVTIFYPSNNPWPAEYVTPLFQSYQGKIQIFMGGPAEAAVEEPAAPAAVTAETEPAETQAAETQTVEVQEETVPETTQAETEPVTEAAEQVQETAPETVPETTKAPSLKFLEETTPEEEVPEQTKQGRNMGGILLGLCLITGTLSLLLIGALIFRRRSY